MKKTLFTVLTLVLVVTLGANIAKAVGSLTPSGNAGDATQYTLNDIYTKLTENTSTSTKSGLFTLPGSVVATFRTLTEIYDAIPTIDATKVATGTSYLGVTGTLIARAPELDWSQFAPTNLTWNNAVVYCATLTEGGATAGDWRLPTLVELSLEMIDYIHTKSSGSGLVFDDLSSYWSGETSIVDGNYAFNINLNGGGIVYIEAGEKINSGLFAVCVR